LRERLRGAALADSGVFAASTASLLRHLRLDGTLAWERELDYAPAPLPSFVHGGRVWVHALNPAGLRVHDAATGAAIQDEGAEAVKEWPERLVRAIVLSGGRVLLGFERSLRLLDLESGEMRWSIPQQRMTVRDVFHDPDVPGECILLTNRTANSLPGLVGVSLEAGREQWRYEKFPTISASFGIERERNEIFVLHGHEQWSLLALHVREDFEGQGATVEPLWPNEAPLGHLIGTTEGRLFIGGDAVYFADPDGGISAFDRAQGTLLSAPVEPIRSYLLEKEDVTCARIGGRLVVLTDGGDCAFESIRDAAVASSGTEPAAPQDEAPASLRAPADVLLFNACRQGLSDLRTVSRLALSYFRLGDLESAIQLLSRSLGTDDVGKESPTDASSPQRGRILGYLLDGIKEESMRRSVPRFSSRRMKTPPLIDGDLSDAWDLATAVHLDSPTHVTSIPGPEAARDWEGEEDLAAVLYTGWDDTHFYFALDVKDDFLHPYDKDAENWKGDCLIIGLDPLGDGGFRQNADDQLMTLALTIPKRKKLSRDKDENDPEAGADGEEQEDEDERRKPAGLFSVKKKDDNSGAIYEVGLPWSSMILATRRPGGPPSPGYAFGLSLLLTDDDSGQGATKTLSANPCHLLPRNQKHSQMFRFIIPYYFPRVTLE
jgi:outer membrane protein assembly factor BamB